MISHLFFADDSIIFFRATQVDCLQVKHCIQTYEVASGQMVNYEKSAITFCPSSSQVVIDEIRRTLGISVVRGHELYLGLPTFSLRSKRVQFAPLRDKVYRRINGWTSKLFSAGGKEVLIKSVLQAIPTYAMTCFKIPSSICHELEQQFAKFWWRNSSGKRNMHWVRWDSLCKPKQLGGLGFRRMVEFNKALLAKQVWRLIQFPDSLMAKALKARYFRNSDVMDAPRGLKPSYIWQSILWGRDLISKGIQWRVGDGCNIFAFKDAWIPGIFSGKSSVHLLELADMKVKEFIGANGIWNVTALRHYFPTFEIEEILNIPINPGGGVDRRFWKWDHKGIYSVKSGYQLQLGIFEPHPFSSSLSSSSWWSQIWNLKIPPKWVYSLLVEFRNAQNVIHLPSHNNLEESNFSWVKPRHGHYRLDVDASFDAVKGIYSIGAIVRDDAGSIVGATAFKIRCPSSVLGGELMAILQGLLFCKRLHISCVGVFSDSMGAVRAVTESSDFIGPEGILVDQVKELLLDNVFEGLFHIRRQANSVAHSLAKFVCSSIDFVLWSDAHDVPLWFQKIVSEDIGE